MRPVTSKNSTLRSLQRTTGDVSLHTCDMTHSYMRHGDLSCMSECMVISHVWVSAWFMYCRAAHHYGLTHTWDSLIQRLTHIWDSLIHEAWFMYWHPSCSSPLYLSVSPSLCPSLWSSVYVSIFLSLCHSFSFSVHLSVLLCMCRKKSCGRNVTEYKSTNSQECFLCHNKRIWKNRLCLSVSLSPCLSVSLSPCLSVCLCLCLSLSVSVCLCLCLFMFSSISHCLLKSIDVSVSLCLSVSMSRCLGPHSLSWERGMGWLRLGGSLKLQVSFAKEPYKRDIETHCVSVSQCLDVSMSLSQYLRIFGRGFWHALYWQIDALIHNFVLFRWSSSRSLDCQIRDICVCVYMWHACCWHIDEMLHKFVLYRQSSSRYLRVYICRVMCVCAYISMCRVAGA